VISSKIAPAVSEGRLCRRRNDQQQHRRPAVSGVLKIGAAACTLSSPRGLIILRAFSASLSASVALSAAIAHAAIALGRSHRGTQPMKTVDTAIPPHRRGRYGHAPHDARNLFSVRRPRLGGSNERLDCGRPCCRRQCHIGNHRSQRRTLHSGKHAQLLQHPCGNRFQLDPRDLQANRE
jgi:hypothetical protein